MRRTTEYNFVQNRWRERKNNVIMERPQNKLNARWNVMWCHRRRHHRQRRKSNENVCVHQRTDLTTTTSICVFVFAWRSNDCTFQIWLGRFFPLCDSKWNEQRKSGQSKCQRNSKWPGSIDCYRRYYQKSNEMPTDAFISFLRFVLLLSCSWPKRVQFFNLKFFLFRIAFFTERMFYSSCVLFHFFYFPFIFSFIFCAFVVTFRFDIFFSCTIALNSVLNCSQRTTSNNRRRIKPKKEAGIENHQIEDMVLLGNFR